MLTLTSRFCSCTSNQNKYQTKKTQFSLSHAFSPHLAVALSLSQTHTLSQLLVMVFCYVLWPLYLLLCVCASTSTGCTQRVNERVREHTWMWQFCNVIQEDADVIFFPIKCTVIYYCNWQLLIFETWRRKKRKLNEHFCSLISYREYFSSEFYNVALFLVFLWGFFFVL